MRIVNFVIGAVFFVLQITTGILVIVTILHFCGVISISDHVNSIVVNILKPDTAIWLFAQKQRFQELLKIN